MLQPGPQHSRGGMSRIPILGKIVNKAADFAFIFKIRKMLMKLKPDIFQVNPSILPWLIPLITPKSVGLIFDVNQINLGARQGWIGKVKEHITLLEWRLCAKLLYDHSRFHHALAAKKLLGAAWPKRASLVTVGVGKEFLDPETPDLVSTGKIRMIYIGAITRYRDLERLLLAARRLQDSTNRFQIDLVGPDQSEGYYHAMLDRLDIDRVVSIKPPVPYDKMHELLRRYHVGIAYVPDRPTWDLQPTIKVLEYRAIGLPILSTDVASHQEVVVQNVNGLLVENSVEGLAAGMLRLVEDQEFLSMCRANALEMRRGITWDEVAERFEVLVYQKLVSNRRENWNHSYT